MQTEPKYPRHGKWPVVAHMPTPAKALITMIILTLTMGMSGALGQIIIHDIIPTFYSENEDQARHGGQRQKPSTADDTGGDAGLIRRGDLFSESPSVQEPAEPPRIYRTEQFVWTLKWTHIHLFGMGMIFIFTGAVALFLDLPGTVKTWLIILPFIGVWIDIATVWLKGYVSPAFFWLHIPGGVMFGAIFAFVSIRALWEMWWSESRL